MPPANRRRARDVDAAALSALSSSAPVTRAPDVDPVLAASADRSTSTAPTPPAPTASTKVRFGAQIDRDVAEQVRDAVVHLGGDWTVARLIEEALAEKVARLAAQYGHDDLFPSRATARLRAGRRVS